MFQTTLDGTTTEPSEALCHINALAELAPHVKLKLTDDSWTAGCFFGLTPMYAVSTILDIGRSRISDLDMAGLTNRSDRQWRLFPILLASDRLWLKDQAGSADVDMVMDWAENGI